MTLDSPGGSGFVSLVGAGPGDPELLTRRGLRRLEEADAVVYDRLVSPELLDCCRPDAVRYDVGKIPGGCSSARQEDINELLVQLGRLGRRVVRLKGGDPFVFGRGGEEALALATAGVPFEVVPGVSSALAVPAAAGIPVTHRGLATSVTIATGHGEHGMADHDWGALARIRGTLVFLMAVVRCGTMPCQTEVQAPLGAIAATVRSAGITSPAVLVIGWTVALADGISRAEPLMDPAEYVTV